MAVVNRFPRAGERLTVKDAVINVAVGTSTSIVGAVTAKKIRVNGLCIATASAGAITFQGSTTVLTGVIPLAANSPMVLPFSEAGYFETLAGQFLAVTNTSTMDGCLTYTEL